LSHINKDRVGVVSGWVDCFKLDGVDGIGHENHIDTKVAAGAEVLCELSAACRSE
jgi:hypothetical protein